MLAESIKHFKIALKLLILLTLLTGILYPLVVTGLAQLLFPWQANGSLIDEKGEKLGSRLIGQAFSDNKYFWGRPSATSPFPYNGENSSGSNVGPSNPALLTAVKMRASLLRQADPQNLTPLPVDLVTASGSGLDPEISPLAAFYQVARVAKARGLAPEKVQALVQTFVKARSFGILGEPRVNVLELNLALDHLSPQKKNHA